MPRKVLLAFGTRPEAIKMAPVLRALQSDPEAFETVCCVTAQHRGLLDQALDIFGIVPDIDLDLMRTSQAAPAVHAAVLTAMTAVLAERRPDLVLVHGDTTTTAATALAAFHEGIPVGHIEAGLRSGDMGAPFPEECNRRITSLLTRYHFAPTPLAAANLKSEGCSPASILVTGNTVVDALRMALRSLDGAPDRHPEAAGRLDADLPFAWREKQFVLLTCHRRETATRKFDEVLDAFSTLAATNPEVNFVYPVHPNPLVCVPAHAHLGGRRNLHLIDPLPYDAFLLALRQCRFVLTDSGGLQEEGPALGKPVLVMRAVTERPEGVEAGGVRIVGTEGAGIVSAATELLNDRHVYEEMAKSANPYGDGRAAQRIAAFLKTAV